MAKVQNLKVIAGLWELRPLRIRARGVTVTTTRMPSGQIWMGTPAVADSLVLDYLVDRELLLATRQVY